MTSKFSSSRDPLETLAHHLLAQLGHEYQVLGGHWAELRERWTLLRVARSPRQLWAVQRDLFPESSRRRQEDHRQRRVLWAQTRDALRPLSVRCRVSR